MPLTYVYSSNAAVTEIKKLIEDKKGISLFTLSLDIFPTSKLPHPPD